MWQEHHLYPGAPRFCSCHSLLRQIWHELSSFSRRFVNFQSAVLRFSPTTATNQMLIWIQDLKGNQQMYGLITELERKLGLRWPSEWTIPRKKKCHCQIFTSMSVFTHRCMPQILHENWICYFQFNFSTKLMQSLMLLRNSALSTPFAK